MDKFIKPSRIVILSLVMALLLSVYALTLYRIQALDSEALLDETAELTATDSVVYAARGSLLDRNGVLLASDRTVYDVRIDRSQLLKSEDPNGMILTLIGLAGQYGVKYNDIFPVTTTAPFEYYVDATAKQKSWLNSYFAYFTKSLGIEDPENPDVSATDLISWMRGHYKIPYTATAEDARKIIGVRYGLEMQVINYSDYVFASDVSQELVSCLSEQDLPSVSIVTRSEREYHTPYASHLIGYIGSMSSDEYNDKYKDLGYPYNAQIGKTGAESAFEEYLHGVDGEITTYRDPSGAITDVEVKKEAQAGSNVYLTVDIKLQQVAENALASTIAQMNLDRTEEAREKSEKENTVYEEPDLANGGAAVVIDVDTGEVLALASYPTFDLSTFFDDFAALNSDPLSPLINRATQGTYNPGSTFKMVTAYAALSGHTISPQTTIRDEGQFMKYAPGYAPRCWAYPNNHGTINVTQALEKSCNYFFYSVADNMGITRIAEAARLFGFGSPTGIEIGDASGTVASIEAKQEALHEGWWNADTLIACIGQGLNLFTPIQMANYVATIANGGTHYYTTVLRNITSYDYSDVLLRRAPKVESVIEDTEGYIPVLQRGMRAVVRTGTAANALSNYPIPVAAKTGTVQTGSTINDGVFVCYAPADDPEIAIAVVVQKGGSGAALITVAKDLMDAYFTDTSTPDVSVATDNTLLK